MAVPTKDAVLPNDAPDSLCLEKHIDFIAKYGQVINVDLFIIQYWHLQNSIHF